MTSYGKDKGLPIATVGRIAFDSRGTAWAAATAGLYRLESGRWQRVLPNQPLVMTLLVDRQDRVWFIARDALFVLAPGEASARRLGDAKFDDATTLVQGPDDSVWLSGGGDGSIQRFGPEGRRPVSATVPTEPATLVLFGRAGAVWSLGPGGLARADADAWVDPQSRRHPPVEWSTPAALSGDNVFALLEDREGSIWVGTNGGIDRFHRSRFSPQVAARSSVPVALAAQGNDAWIGRIDEPLLRLGGRPHTFDRLAADFSALLPTSDGVTWVGDRVGRVWRIDADDSITEVPGPSPTGRGSIIQALARDGDKRLWAATAFGPFRLEDGGWVAMKGRGGLSGDTALTMSSGPGGRIWLGYPDASVVVYGDDAHVARYAQEAGPGVGAVFAFRFDGDRVWIGGDSGLALWQDGRFVVVADEERRSFHGVSGIVRTKTGDLWLNTSDGVVHLPAEEVERFIAHGDRLHRYEIFDQRDGINGRAPQAGGSLPTMAASDDGRLWISEDGFGVASIAPATIERNLVPPPAVVLNIRANDVDLPVSDGLVLPALTRSVQIHYTGLGLANPERDTFRYRLTGVDASWQDAQRRRTVTYTNLGPGRYEFQVLAANEDGVASAAPATVDFSIAPSIYETDAFRVLSAAALIGCFVLVYAFRVRALTVRATEKARERQDERERIAGELHDTLLQGIYGLLLRLQSLLDRVTDPHLGEALTGAIEQTERLVEEGRDRVAGLRALDGAAMDLGAALEAIGDELSGNGRLTVRVRVEGTVDYLRPQVRDEIYYIASEALMNVDRHAEASGAYLALRCDRHSVRLLVRDNGLGIKAEALEADGMPGHWGVRGMHERAARINGRLDIARGSKAGTTVKLLVPAQGAYVSVGRRAWMRLRSWLHRDRRYGRSTPRIRRRS